MKKNIKISKPVKLLWRLQSDRLIRLGTAARDKGVCVFHGLIGKGGISRLVSLLRAEGGGR